MATEAEIIASNVLSSAIEYKRLYDTTKKNEYKVKEQRLRQIAENIKLIVGSNSSSAVSSFNGRTGAVVLTSGDVTGALGFTPLSAESDTLDSVTGRGNTTTNTIDVGGVTSDYVLFDTTATPTLTQGMMSWDVDRSTVAVQLNGVSAKLGQDNFWYVKNQSGSTIPKGKAVMAVGTLGASGRILIDEMVANGSVSAKYLLGITAESIADGADGFVMNIGKIRQLDTSAWPDGTVLYCDASTPGNLTATAPSSPNLALPVAFVVHSAANGIIAVRIQTLDENAFATPTLDQVTTAGNTTANGITVGGVVGPSVFEIYSQFSNRGRITLLSSTTTASIPQIQFLTDGSVRGLFTKGGNLLIGTMTDAGYKLDVNGTARVSGNLAATGNYIQFGTNVNVGIGSTSNGGTFVNNGSALLYASANINTAINLYGHNFYSGNYNATSGTQGVISLTGGPTFSPTSGTAVFNVLNLAFTINQTGGANGITRGLYVNPTLTSAADFRAIETSAGKVIHQGLTNATHSDVVYYNSATGELTYGAAPGGGGSGTVTSVAMTVPTGLTVSGSPITTSGTLAVALQSGYSIPTTASQTNWDTAYTNRITSLTTTGTSGAATLSSNTLNIPNYSVSFTNNTNNYVMTGTGTTNTLNGEANLRFDGTTLRIGPDSDNNTNYFITTQNQLIIHANDNAGNDNFNTYLILRSGSGSNLSTIGIVGSGNNNFINFATSNTDRMRLFSDGNLAIGTSINNGFKLDVQGSIRSTSTINATLANVTTSNVVYYNTSNGLFTYGAAPSGGSGTVTSVAMTVPTGLTVSGSPITTSGTLAVSLQSGYSIPTTASQTNWNTAYGWGDHASAGYLTAEADTLATVTARGATTTTQMSVGALVNSTGSYNSKLELSGEGGFHSSKFTFNSQGRFIAGQVSVKGTNDIFFQALPNTTSGYGFLETWQGAGMVVGTGGNANPVIFQTNRTERMRLAVTTGNVLIGTTTDSGYKLDVNGTIRSNNTITASGGDSTEWNTAYSWGDHSTQGYLTGTTGFTGIFTIPTNPPGQQNLDIVDGLIVNIF